jgi:DNA modification methylase
MPHPHNTLNHLDGSRWMYFTKSLLTTAYPPEFGHELRKAHGANKPPRLMKDLIEFFTRGDAEVLDCFAGVGGTLIGSAIADPPRRAVGIEINARWIEIYRQVVQLAGLAQQEMIHGDCLPVMREMSAERFDFIALDPPYGIHLEQTMARTDYDGAFTNRRTDYNMRSQDERDLANLPSYADYLTAMGEVFQELYRLLKPGKYMVFIVRDAYQNGEMLLVHADLASAARRCGFTLKSDHIWYQAGTRLRPYGYPYAFVPNIVHQHIVVVQKDSRADGKRSKPRGARERPL